jgi:hypothetical protein
MKRTMSDKEKEKEVFKVENIKCPHCRKSLILNLDLTKVKATIQEFEERTGKRSKWTSGRYRK